MMVVLGLDAKKFQDGMNKANKDLNGLNENTKKIQRSMNMMKVAAVAAFAGWGISRVVGQMRELIEASNRQQEALIGMETAMKSMGRYTPSYSKELQKLAQSLQRVTNYGDEATLEGMKFLMTYRDITDDLMPDTIKTMQDLAALMGGGPGGLVRAANMLGKASMGMTGELRRVGITVDRTTYESEGYLGVLKQIQEQVGGQATAMRQATRGYKAVANEVSDLKEAFGELLTIGLGDFWENQADGIRIITQEVKRFTKEWPIFVEMLREGTLWRPKSPLEQYYLQKNLRDETPGQQPGLAKQPEVEKAIEELTALRDLRIKLGEEESQYYFKFQQEFAEAVIELEQIRTDTAFEAASERADAYMEEALAYGEAIRVQEEMDRRREISKQQMLERDKNTMLSYWESTLAMAARENKAFYRMYQAYKLAEAIITGVDATIKSYNWGASWGGPVGGAAMAAITGAFMATKIALIASQDPGYRTGGVVKGPESGYQTTLHGTEAVIPLGRGRLPLQIEGPGMMGQPMNVNVTINAMDALSVQELMARNPDAILGPLLDQLGPAGDRNLRVALRRGR